MSLFTRLQQRVIMTFKKTQRNRNKEKKIETKTAFKQQHSSKKACMHVKRKKNRDTHTHRNTTTHKTQTVTCAT